MIAMKVERGFGPAHGRLAVSALMAGAMLSGCNGTGKPDVTISDAAALPETCYTVPICQAKWAKARKWIADHTSRKVTVGQGVIKTTESTASDPSPAFTVTLAKMQGGGATLNFVAQCYRRCSPSEDVLLGQFNLYVSSSAALPSGPS